MTKIGDQVGLAQCFLTLALIISNIGLASAQDSQATTNEVSTESKIATLRKNLHSLEAMQQSVDQSQINIDALLEKLDFDDGSIVSFVTDEVHYQPYDGLLRGPLATLWARAGNSLDQAVLLAKLLKDAGFEARVVSTEMSPQIRTELAQAAMKPRSLLAPVANETEFRKAFSQMLGEGAKDFDQTEFEQQVNSLLSPSWDLDKTVREQSDRAASYLAAEAGGQLAKVQEHASISRSFEESSYFWVQSKSGASGSWVDIHPAASGLSAVQIPAPQHTYLDSIPENLQHRIRIEVFLEVATKNKLSRLPLVPAWERPVGNMTGLVVKFSNIPGNGEKLFDAFDSAAGDEENSSNKIVVQNLKDDTIFLPYFFGHGATANSFDMNGNVIDALAASSPASGVFQKVGKSFASAAGALDDSEISITTAGQVMVITLIEPGGKETKYERYLFDRLDPESRSTGKYKLATNNTLMTSPFVDAAIYVNTSSVPKAKLLDAYFQQLLNMEPIYKAMIAMNDPGSNVSAAQGKAIEASLSDAIGGTATIDLLTLASVMDAYDPNDSLVFRGRPNIAILTSKIATAGKNVSVLQMVDLVENHVTALSPSEQKGELELDREKAIRKGVWETWMESRLFEPSKQSGLEFESMSFNSINMFADDKLPNFEIMSNPAEFQNSKQKYSAISWRGISSDVSEGFITLLPEDSSLNEAENWWRIDPQSGVTLGRGWDGRGQEMAEYGISGSAGNLGAFLAGRFVDGLISWSVCGLAKTLKSVTEGWAAGNSPGDSPPSPGDVTIGCMPALAAGALFGIPNAGKEAAKALTSIFILFVSY